MTEIRLDGFIASLPEASIIGPEIFFLVRIMRERGKYIKEKLEPRAAL